MASTGSKGPIISLVIAFIVIFFGKIKTFISKKTNILSMYLLLWISMPVCYFIFFTSDNSSIKRLFDIFSDNATSARILLYTDALRAISDHPIGVGVGKFGNYSFFDYPHNLILEAFAELGWLSGSFFVIMIVLSFIGLKKLSAQGFYGDMLLGIFLISLINSMVSGDLTSPKELYLLLPIGLNVFLTMKQPDLKKIKGYRTVT
jgi:O-antigen ligase